MRSNQAFVPDGEHMPARLLEALMGYEAALASDDVELLGAYFVDGDEAMRGDAAGLLVGRKQIDRFRGGRGGAPTRVLGDIQVRPVGADHAYVTSVTAPAKGGRGMVTQLWRKTQSPATPGGWVIVAAHVSSPPAAIDTRVWRVVGNPLIEPPNPDGPLAGLKIAVKDVFAVPGHRIGGGVPAFLTEAPVESSPADALAALLDAGASVTGIAQTDQFAYSIAGINSAYGTPPNPVAPGSIPGGSSSGPASAVAAGQADIGLGTDTAGSIRVPASYQGLWGLRPTHGAVSLDGVLPLAPAYDTPGWMARRGATLLAAARASLSPASQRPVGSRATIIAPALFEAADQEVGLGLRSVVDSLVAHHGVIDEPEAVEVPSPAELFRIFRYTQSPEAARSWSTWIDSHPGALGADVAARFAWAASVTAEEEAEALEAKAAARAALDEALGDRILLLPSASSAAPALDSSPERLNEVREATLALTAVAGITGRPALSVPWFEADGPVGLCLVGPRGSDLALIETAIAWADAAGLPA